MGTIKLDFGEFYYRLPKKIKNPISNEITNFLKFFITIKTLNLVQIIINYVEYRFGEVKCKQKKKLKRKKKLMKNIVQ